jgi:cytidylate kinase
MIITISRQYGAGGSEVARRVATALDWALVDNDVVDKVAARSGLKLEEVAAHDERAPGFVERLARTLATSAPDVITTQETPMPGRTEQKLVHLTEAVVAEIAEQERVVVVGRAAPAVLGRRAGTLHIKLVAPKPWRISVAARRLGVDLHTAEKTLEDTDGNRRRYHQQYYSRDWDDPCNYDMVLNTESLGYEEVVEVIVGRAKWRWPGETKERRRGT